MIRHKVTIVMTVFNNFDFTMASIWAIKKFYGDIRIILTDGGSTNKNKKKYFNYSTTNDIVYIYNRNMCTEDCRNIAVNEVKTEYVLFMDNDTKILDKSAIPLLLNVVEKFSLCVQTGAYAVKRSTEENVSFVGKNFKGHVDCDAFPAYFSLHHVLAYRAVGGMPKEFFYNVPKNLISDNEPGYSGDFSITANYQKNGLIAKTPCAPVPVLHWGQANRWFNEKRPIEDWWYENITHKTIDPFFDTGA